MQGGGFATLATMPLAVVPLLVGRIAIVAASRDRSTTIAAGLPAGLVIARRMGLGRPTVTRILSNAMAKLGATSRAQAVTLLRAIP